MLAMSDIVWQALIGAVLAAWLEWMRRSNKNAIKESTVANSAKVDEIRVEQKKENKVVAEKVAEVKQVQEETAAAATEAMASIAKTGEANHVLLNSAHGAALDAVAVLARWKADKTQEPADMLAADHAEKMSRDHQGKQARVDAKEK